MALKEHSIIQDVMVWQRKCVGSYDLPGLVQIHERGVNGKPRQLQGRLNAEGSTTSKLYMLELQKGT